MPRRSYGPPKEEYAAGAAWLETFIHTHGLTQDQVSHILGVNHARVWEWLHQQDAIPEEAVGNLRAWSEAGGPQFTYWL